MRVLLVSEGVHELGDEHTPGALGILVSRVLGRAVQFVTEQVSSKKIHIHMLPGASLGYTKRALGWVRYAEQNGHDAIVLVIDRDGDDNRRDGINAAQKDERVQFPRALGVAIEAFDAWMLADEQALSKALGVTVQRDPDPEAIRHPKAELKRVAVGAGAGQPHRGTYADIAGICDLAVIEDRCPTGFRPFAQRVRAL